MSFPQAPFFLLNSYFTHGFLNILKKILVVIVFLSESYGDPGDLSQTHYKLGTRNTILPSADKDQNSVASCSYCPQLLVATVGPVEGSLSLELRATL